MRFQGFKVFSCVPDVHQRRLGGQRRIAGHHHHVRVTREDIDEGGKLTVAHLHRLEFGTQFRAGQLELLDYIRDLFEAVWVSVAFPLAMRYDEKSGALKQQHLVGVYDARKGAQGILQHLHVRYQHVDYVGPGPVQRLVPDARLEAGAVEWLRKALQVLFAFLENLVLLLVRHQVHFVDEAEDLCIRRVVQNGLQA